LKPEVDHQDVLQNLEAAIVGLYRRHPEMLDYDVDAALEAVLARYAAVQRDRPEPAPPAGELRAALYQGLCAMCDWRLGRAEGPVPVEPLETDVIVACLKRLRKSVRTWNRNGGRQGYLTFVQRYVPGA
jgi:hypothetical protein